MSTDTIDNLTKKTADNHVLQTDVTADFYFDLASLKDKDYAVWAKYPSWTVEEAIALSFGKNPKLVNWFTIQPLIEESEFAKEYAVLRNLVLRAVDIGVLTEKVRPTDFVSWLKLNCYTVSAKLDIAVTSFKKQQTETVSQLKKLTEPLTDKQKRVVDLEKKQKTLHLIIYTITRSRAGLLNSNAEVKAKAVEQWFVKEGLSLSYNTIHDALKQANQTAERELEVLSQKYDKHKLIVKNKLN